MLTSLPRDQVIKVVSVLGDNECFDFAAQIREFLRANGFHVGVESQALYIQPVRGLTLNTGANPIELIIGPE